MTKTKTYPGLPETCYARSKTTGGIVMIMRGEKGFIDITDGRTLLVSECEIKRINKSLGVTPAQAEAMYFGALFGWDRQVANPALHEETRDYKTRR